MRKRTAVILNLVENEAIGSKVTSLEVELST